MVPVVPAALPCVHGACSPSSATRKSLPRLSFLRLFHKGIASRHQHFQVAAGQDQIDAKTQQLADTDEGLAQAKEDIEDTKASLAADEQFLLMLKEKCSMTDKEWEERQKTRQLEM